MKTYTTLTNHQETRLENKRKRQKSNQDDLNVSRSFSQLSISQDKNPKKNKRLLQQ